MANNTAWVGGNLNSGLSWATLINSADLLGLVTGNSMLSNAISINNGTGLDQFMDISIQLTLAASSAVAAGANITIWLALLQQDGTTYGDGILVAGTSATVTPPWSPTAVIPLYASTRANLAGQANGIIIPPGQFKAILQNNSGFNLHASTAQACTFRSYNQQLNH